MVQVGNTASSADAGWNEFISGAYEAGSSKEVFSSLRLTRLRLMYLMRLSRTCSWSLKLVVCALGHLREVLIPACKDITFWLLLC